MGRAEASIGEALAEVVRRSGVPYGYTLTVWSSGAVCTWRCGLPGPGEVLLFVAGATAAYVGLALPASRVGSSSSLPPAAIRANLLPLPALGVVYLINSLLPWAGASFFLSAFLATLVYFLGLARLVSRAWRRSAHPQGNRPAPFAVLLSRPGGENRPGKEGEHEEAQAGSGRYELQGV